MNPDVASQPSELWGIMSSDRATLLPACLSYVLLQVGMIGVGWKSALEACRGDWPTTLKLLRHFHDQGGCPLAPHQSSRITTLPLC